MRAIQALSVALPPLYAVSALLHAPSTHVPRPGPLVRIRGPLLAATLVLHALLLVARGFEIAQFPVNDLASTVSAVAWSTVILWVVVARTSGHGGSGGLVLGLATIATSCAAAFGDLVPHARAAEPHAAQIAHVATSCVALAALVLSGLHGALYLLLLHEMRARRFGALFEDLPNLDQLARMTRGAALVGFVGLAIGLNVGIALAHAESTPGFRYADPEVLVSIVLWLYFGAIAFSQRIPGFGARRASWAATGGLVVLVLSALLVLLPGSFHAQL